jgi:DNA repair photolyase
MLNEAMMTKRMMFKGLGVLAGAMLVGPILPREARAGHAEKLKEMLEKGDHAGLAEYYKKEADEARHKAEGQKAMASEYLKKYPKNQYAKHCEKMADKYLEEAKENDALAEIHSKAAKGGK